MRARGGHVRIATGDIASLSAELAEKDYRYAKPGPPRTMPWGSLELTVTDPFANRLTFHQEVVQ